MNNDSKAKRVIVITGASAGLGRAIAQAFARTEGARIGLIARGKEGLERAKCDVEKLGGKALMFMLVGRRLRPLSAINFSQGLLDHYLARTAFNLRGN